MVSCLLAIAPLTYAQPPAAAPDDDEVARGRVLYRIHCASCHGKEGRGDGPVADALRKRPVDLTRLARDARGEFPAERVTASIDGRAELRSHGTREMPVWGITFGELGRDTSQEREVQAEIRALVRYIRSLQEH
jgi:mono/diheme cytochrome c family protein